MRQEQFVEHNGQGTLIRTSSLFGAEYDIDVVDPSWRGKKSHRKLTMLLVVPLGVKESVLVPLEEFSLKRSTTGAFAVPFRISHLTYPLCALLRIRPQPFRI